jgi:hypothetical protein
MKIYFFERESAYVADFVFVEDEPKNYTAAFELQPGQSHFAARYSVENQTLVDKYPDKTDDEVAVILQQLELEKVAQIAAKFST